MFAYGAAAMPHLRWAPETWSAQPRRSLYAVDRQALLPRSQVLDGLEAGLRRGPRRLGAAGSTLEPGERMPSFSPGYHARLRLAAVRYVLSFRSLPAKSS